ncbi:hypothetical protein [Microbulbifer marinus]|uniref:Uncharacterized protein n=1 Tax=Microbulbifer marinus TaxID=658218 RepID=A0A1H4A3K4_9GAMM|nr:hypothetical protein [Microbulbifer marinus]SEA30599.1 hypothetical protein SAMN05216562_2527 [Microbulbifer marinus]
MVRFLPLIALIVALNGCGRQSDTHDPTEVERTPPGEMATEAMEEPITPPEDDSGTATTDQSGTAPQGTDAETPEICTPEWFAWVHEQIQSRPDGDLAEQYPSGLPEVGSDEWFIAVDKLTGGDGAHGPDGGSAEWCSMVQQRLGTPAQ